MITFDRLRDWWWALPSTDRHLYAGVAFGLAVGFLVGLNVGLG